MTGLEWDLPLPVPFQCGQCPCPQQQTIPDLLEMCSLLQVACAKYLY